MSRHATTSRPATAATIATSALLLALGACRPTPPPVATASGPSLTPEAPIHAPVPPGRENKLIIAVDQEPQKLNAALNAIVTGTYISNGIYGFFVKYDENINLIPDVLTEIPTLENGGISADGLTYTYHLRPNLKWHDGVPFTSADVLFSIDCMMNPKHEIESRTGYDEITTKEAPDELTVVVHLKETYAPFVETLFFSEGLMPRHVLEPFVGEKFGSAPFHRAPIGLGPYKFKEWVTGSHVTLEKNPDYWRGAPAIDEITFKFIPDTNAMLNSLRAGEVDGYDNAGTDQRKQLEKIPGIKAHVTPQLMWEHVDFNVLDPILSDVRVRRAIQLAIDRDQISKEIYDGLWPAAHGDVSPRLTQWFNPKVDELVRYDPAAAGALLDEAGWKAGKDGMRSRNGKPLMITISTTAGRAQRELAEQVLQQQLQQVGIDLHIQNYNATQFFAPYEQDGILKRGKFQLAMYAWITSPDPNKKSLYHSSQIPPPEGQNYSRYKNPRLDEILEGGLHVLDPVKRRVIYDELQELLATDVPMTPLVWRADVDPMTTRLQNFKPNPTQNGDTWNIYEWRLQ